MRETSIDRGTVRGDVTGSGRQATDQAGPAEILRKGRRRHREDEQPGRLQHAPDFQNRRLELVDVLEHAVAEDEVERLVTDLDGVARRLVHGVVDPRLACQRNLSRIEIDPLELPAGFASVTHEAGHASVATPQVESPPVRRKRRPSQQMTELDRTPECGRGLLRGDAQVVAEELSIKHRLEGLT